MRSYQLQSKEVTNMFKLRKLPSALTVMGLLLLGLAVSSAWPKALEVSIPMNLHQACLISGLVDTDGDGLTDEEETMEYRTDPSISDTDGDSKNDGEEVNIGGMTDTVVTTFSDGSNCKVLVFTAETPEPQTVYVNIRVSDRAVEFIRGKLDITGASLDGGVTYPIPIVDIGADDSEEWANNGRELNSTLTLCQMNSDLSWAFQTYIDIYTRDHMQDIPNYQDGGGDIRVPISISSLEPGIVVLSDLEIEIRIIETDPTNDADHIVLGVVEGVDIDFQAEEFDWSYRRGMPILGTLTITDWTTGEEITTTVDSDGFYSVNLAELSTEPEPNLEMMFIGELNGEEVAFNKGFLMSGDWFKDAVQHTNLYYDYTWEYNGPLYRIISDTWHTTKHVGNLQYQISINGCRNFNQDYYLPNSASITEVHFSTDRKKSYLHIQAFFRGLDQDSDHLDTQYDVYWELGDADVEETTGQDPHEDDEYSFSYFPWNETYRTMGSRTNAASRASRYCWVEMPKARDVSWDTSLEVNGYGYISISPYLQAPDMDDAFSISLSMTSQP